MKKPTVLLINPRMCSLKAARMPLSLLHLGAVLEGKYDYEIIDGNVLDNLSDNVAGVNAINTTLRALAQHDVAAVCITVMPGPQVAPAIELSAAVRAAKPQVPIIWGGYFPTMYPDSAINAPYVDFLVRGQGEQTLLDLLMCLADRNLVSIRDVRGITWKHEDQIIHNPERPFHQPDDFPPLPYHKLNHFDIYLRPSFMGARTAVHQAAIGCRYRCTFCGVVTMFNGITKLSGPARLQQAMRALRDDHGATAIQFYDNNFFDREDNSLPLLEAMSEVALPWWCYARADTLANFSPRTWEWIRKSQLRMAYIGAEAGSDAVLKSMHKGTTIEHTFEAAARCYEYDVTPEFSFVLGGPDDPEGEIEKTLSLIKRIKKIHPTCEVILYFYSPTPQRDPKWVQADATGPKHLRMHLPTLKNYGPQGPTLPTTPEEWTQPQWLSYVCHQDAPWLSPKMRQRVQDFAKVLACRFPTVQDYKTPQWGKTLLKAAASWRYSSGRYDNPWELALIQRAIPLRQPQKESL
jgi:hypothetical protein